MHRTVVSQTQPSSSAEEMSKTTDWTYRMVTVNFLTDDDQIITRTCPLQMSILCLKADLAESFDFPQEVIQLLWKGEEITDFMTLSMIDPEREVFDVSFKITDHEKYSLHKFGFRPTPVTKSITVKVQTTEEEPKDLIVNIEDVCIRKSFLGGFRNKETGTEYHHAVAQTLPRPFRYPRNGLNCRETQTVGLKPKLSETTDDKSTQIPRDGIFIFSESDKIVTASKYITADECEYERLFNLFVIQRNWRRYVLNNYLAEMRKNIEIRKAWLIEQERLKEESHIRALRYEIRRKVFPRTKADFEHLYNLVERWKRAEIQRIGRLKSGCVKKAEIYFVFLRQVEIMNAIQEHKMRLHQQDVKEMETHFLEKSANPIEWHRNKGKLVSMDTLNTQRVRELKEAYDGINKPSMSNQECLEALAHFKEVVQKQNCLFTDELEDLIDRECDLRVRGIPGSKLEALHSRINSLYMEHMHNPEFNPEAPKHMLVYNFKKMLNNLYMCYYCRKFKSLKYFVEGGETMSIRECLKCRYNRNITHKRMDYDRYRTMLNNIRADEVKRKCRSSIAFSLNEIDMYWLVEKVWHRQSPLSSATDVTQLRLCRWDVRKDWSPWNCFLITEEESRAHLHFKDPEELYEELLVQNVKHKHLLAQLRFWNLAEVDKHIIDSGEWEAKQLLKKYHPPPDITFIAEKQAEVNAPCKLNK